VRYRLLVVDVDGTLVGADARVAPAVVQAVQAAVRAGVRVAISTGRTPPACGRYLTTLALNGPQIYFDGSLVLDPADPTPVFERRVDAAGAAAVVAFAQAAGLTVELYTRDGYYVAAVTPEVVAHAALQGCEPVVTDLAAVLAGGQVIKAELVLSTDVARAAVRAFAPIQADQVRFSWATAPGLPRLSFINIVDPTVNKGEAIRALAAHLDLPLSAVVAVGDSPNDVPMFAVAGLAIAMGNAPEAVRQAAHVVTGPVEVDGLAAAIDRYVLDAAQS
jgi:Cof subfamily protein (haloacid dehalogenase superfamily)